MSKAALLVGVAGLTLAVGSAALAQSHTQLKKVTHPQIAAIEVSKAKRSTAEEKVSSQLLDIAKQTQTGSVNSAAPHLKVDGAPVAQQLVQVDIRAKADITPDLLSAITGQGGQIVSQGKYTPVIRAMVPPSAFVSLAARPDVKQMDKAREPTKHTAYASEGRVAHDAVDVSDAHTFGATGAGSVVCVISDSLDDLGHAAKAHAADLHAQDIANHVPGVPNLDPNTVKTLPDEDGSETASQTGEGLAMLEIIHAIAPAAELWFATGNGGPAHMADNIHGLYDAAHCNVMVDDLTYPSESPFQDDDISRAVDFVTDAGVLYFSSARNSGNMKHKTSGTWEGMFHDGGPVGAKYKGINPKAHLHIFTGKIVVNNVTKAGMYDRVDLFWSDPLGGSRNGYDLFVVDNQGNVLRSSTTSHTGSQDPYQSVDHLHSGENILIVKEANAAPRFLHLETGRGVLRYGTTGSVRGHNANGSPNSFTVAARGVSKPAVLFAGGADAKVEDFSSDGPRRVFFDPEGKPYTPGNFSDTGGRLLQKPDITAADGVSTTFPDQSELNPFLGTSAAAPHAAAIAALMLSCKPKPSAAKVRDAFKSSAIAIEGAPGNVNAGYGIVMAKSALTAACPHASITPAPTGPTN
jgi:hypothetical protein